jgi:hypothetical protein
MFLSLKVGLQRNNYMKLAIIKNEHKLSGKLTKFFTDSYAYHVAWVDEKDKVMYDMHLRRRRASWPRYNDSTSITFHDFPEVTRQYLEHQLTVDQNVYGVMDYILFGVRPLFHLVGKSTRNAGGVICSEMINIDLWNCGVQTPWRMSDAPPSPGDFERWVKTIGK